MTAKKKKVGKGASSKTKRAFGTTYSQTKALGGLTQTPRTLFGATNASKQLKSSSDSRTQRTLRGRRIGDVL